MAIDGASRMSSVLGLNVRPSTATVLPRALPPIALMTLRPIARLRLSFTATVASTIRTGESWSCAVFSSAASLDHTVVLCISADLPFAQQRFCGAEGIDKVVMLSMMRDRHLAKDYGVLLEEDRKSTRLNSSH